MFRASSAGVPEAKSVCCRRTGLAYTSLSFGLTFAVAVMWEGDCCQHHQCHTAPEIAYVEISSTFLEEQDIMSSYTDTGHDVKSKYHVECCKALGNRHKH